MMQTRLACAVVLASGWLAFAQGTDRERRNTRPRLPLPEYHPASVQPRAGGIEDDDAPVAAVKPRTDLIEQLDAGIKRAVVLSAAYIFKE
jgi:hypothetical protein